MKPINIHLLQLPARPASGNRISFLDRRCAHCCLRSHKDCEVYRELGVPGCEPGEEFPEGSYFVMVEVPPHPKITLLPGASHE